MQTTNQYELKLNITPPKNPLSNVKLDPASEMFMSRAIADFAKMGLGKFIRGQKEHGGFIASRPMLPELMQEIIDLWMYAKGIQFRDEEFRRKLNLWLSTNLSAEKQQELVKFIGGEFWGQV